MTIFNLPDLGEGLPDAEIHEWYIKVGDKVAQDEPIVSMETAKAVVDVPSPQAGVVLKLYGNPGTMIRTGQPLIEFEALENQKSSATVVGELEEQAGVHLNHLPQSQTLSNRPKASVKVRAYANSLNINLEDVVGTDEYGVISIDDINAHRNQNPHLSQNEYEPLKGVRRQMAEAMQKSHQQVVPVTIFDDVNIAHWQKPYDISVRLIEAICFAVKEEPSLNVWFNGRGVKRLEDVNLGLAIDNAEGLFVPVIKKVNHLKTHEIREKIDSLKKAVADRSLPPEEFMHASFTLSNFGKFAGKYASPIIVPPMVAILAVGRLYDNGKILPLSLSFDHRAVTGGEATRFLGQLMQSLESSIE